MTAEESLCILTFGHHAINISFVQEVLKTTKARFELNLNMFFAFDKFLWTIFINSYEVEKLVKRNCCVNYARIRVFTDPHSPISHFSPVSHFYTPWKRQKNKGFLTFSGGIEMRHWTKMGYKSRIYDFFLIRKNTG